MSMIKPKKYIIEQLVDDLAHIRAGYVRPIRFKKKCSSEISLFLIIKT